MTFLNYTLRPARVAATSLFLTAPVFAQAPPADPVPAPAEAPAADKAPESEPAPAQAPESRPPSAQAPAAQPLSAAQPPSAQPPSAQPPSAQPPQPAPAAPEVTLAPPAPVAETPAPFSPAPLPPAAILPPAEPEKPAPRPIQYSGDFFSRYELRSGYAEQGLSNARLHRDGDTVVYRARLGLQTNPMPMGETTHAAIKFVPQAAGTHAIGPGPATILDGYDLKIYEAFFRLSGDTYTLDAGRFAMNYGDARVIGNLGWNETARAFQGARVRFIPGDTPFWIDVFATLITEGTPGPSMNGAGFGDKYFYGIYTDFGPLISEGMHLDFYLLGHTYGADMSTVVDTMSVATTTRFASATELTAGARIQQKVGSFDYQAEAGYQFGTRPGPSTATVSAYQADGEVGITPLPGFRIGIGGLLASGDDASTEEAEDYNQLYPTAHKFLGLSDVFGGRTDAAAFNWHLRYQASPNWLFKHDGHLLNRMEKENNGTKHVGTELDFSVTHSLGGGVGLRSMYALFLPSTDYWPAENAVHFFELQFGYKFN